MTATIAQAAFIAGIDIGFALYALLLAKGSTS
jgi:hypothetical protein